MEACFLLLKYILITQPSANISTRRERNILSEILNKQELQEIEAIVQDNQIIAASTSSLLQKYKAAYRQYQRLNVVLIISDIEKPAFPTLKKLALEWIQNLLQEKYFWQKENSVQTKLSKAIAQLTPRMQTQLGIHEVLMQSLKIGWLNTAAHFKNTRELISHLLLF